MSEKISLEALLPCAIELFKIARGAQINIKATEKPEAEQKRNELIDEFASLTLRLHKKLNHEA